GYTIGVTTGAQTAEQIGKAAPDYIVSSLHEIESVLKLEL
ncbi:MAG: HAD family hydrolase, partial [Phaeodactylibacter sp.]|nr:HAD family hydrolase [Phaeodactylibacter sp.]